MKIPWPVVEIGEITLPVEKVDPVKLFPKGEFKYIDISSIDSKSYKVVEAKTFLAKNAPSRARQVVEENDIAFSTVRTNLKRIAKIDKEFDKQIASTGFAIIRPASQVIPSYLFYYLITDEFTKEISLLQRGASYPAVRTSDVFSRRIPLAPLPEQKRIVAKLDTLFAHLEQLRARLDKIPVLLKQFRQAVLTQAVTGKLTESNTKGWKKISLENLCTKITDGEHITPPLVEFGIPLLSAKDVRDGFIDFTDCKYVPNEFGEKSWQRCNPESGDVLVVSRGATVGRSSFINTTKRFCLMGSVLLFKPKKELIFSQYLEIFFKSPFGLNEIVNMSGATAQQAVYIRDMKVMEVLLPDMKTQGEIVRRIHSIFTLVDNIEAKYQSLKEKIDHLPHAILLKAFRGQLVKNEIGKELKAYSQKADELLMAAEPETGFASKR